MDKLVKDIEFVTVKCIHPSLINERKCSEKKNVHPSEFLSFQFQHKFLFLFFFVYRSTRLSLTSLKKIKKHFVNIFSFRFFNFLCVSSQFFSSFYTQTYNFW